MPNSMIGQSTRQKARKSTKSVEQMKADIRKEERRLAGLEQADDESVMDLSSVDPKKLMRQEIEARVQQEETPEVIEKQQEPEGEATETRYFQNPQDPAQTMKAVTKEEAEWLEQQGWNEINSPVEGVVKAPWIDPVDAAAGAGGASIVKAGLKKALPTMVKVLPQELMMEPFIGTAQHGVNELMAETDAPGAVKAPVNLLSSVLVGQQLSSAVGRTARTAKLAHQQGMRKAMTGSNQKSADLQEAFFSRGTEDQYTKEVQRKMREQAKRTQGQELANGAAAFYQKYIGSPVWDKLIQQQAPKFFESLGMGKATRALMEGRRPGMTEGEEKSFNKIWEDLEDAQSLGAEYGFDLGDRLSKLDVKDQQAVGDFLRGERGNVPDRIKGIARESQDALTKLGQEAVDVGLLNEETFFKNWGLYFPRFYSSKEYNKALERYSLSKPGRMQMERFKQRKDIPKEIREMMGEMKRPAYPIAKGIRQLASDVETRRFQTKVEKNPAWIRDASDETVDWDVLPDNQKLGPLRGKKAHPDVYEHLNAVDNLTGDGMGQKVLDKVLPIWKYSKTVANPATHVRNMMSNGLLAHMGGMPLHKQPKYLKEAGKQISKGGEYFRLAKQHGLVKSSFIRSELNSRLMDDIETDLKPDDVKSDADGVGAMLGDAMGSMFKKAQKMTKKGADIYQAEEHIFKVAKMIHNMEEKGMTAPLAAKDSEKWLFDYNKLTGFQRQYRRSVLGHPFATFSFKAIPRVAETAVKAPWRFAAPVAISQGLKEMAQIQEGESDEVTQAKRELLPDWMAGSFPLIPNYQRVPMFDSGDDPNRDTYLNTRFIYPWGDLAAEDGFTGIPGVNIIPQGLEPLSHPVTRTGIEFLENTDLFRHKRMVKKEDLAGRTGLGSAKKQAKEFGKAAFKEFAPTVMGDFADMARKAQGKGDWKGRQQSWGALLADAFAGIKTRPVYWRDQIQSTIREQDPRSGQLARGMEQQMKTLAQKRATALQEGRTERAQELEQKIEETAQRMMRHAQKFEDKYGEALQKVSDSLLPD